MSVKSCSMLAAKSHQKCDDSEIRLQVSILYTKPYDPRLNGFKDVYYGRQLVRRALSPTRDPRAGKILMTWDTVNKFLPRISLLARMNISICTSNCTCICSTEALVVGGQSGPLLVRLPSIGAVALSMPASVLVFIH